MMIKTVHLRTGDIQTDIYPLFSCTYFSDSFVLITDNKTGTHQRENAVKAYLKMSNPPRC